MDKEHLIKKWLDGDLTDKETKEFKALEHAQLFEEIIQEAKRFDGKQHAEVNSFEIIEKELNKINSLSLNWVKITSRIAAIFILGVALFFLLDKDKINTFSTDYAKTETINLPDESIVNLNELSELEYNASKWDKNRILKLKGEAFFIVKKGKRFDVNTDFGKVSVLGTQFNVLSRDSIFKVSCYEGLVQVLYGTEKIKLPAGTEFLLISGSVKKSNITVKEPYWLKNMSVFENATLEDVISEIEKQYSIKITQSFDDEELRFTGAFEHNNLKNALKSITQPLNLTYEIITNKEVIIRNVKD